ncbi:cytochrome C oxidase subunit IV family protein [Nocardia sp. NPDC059246]|uniref:cytochrome C oxidase subunit IV family protein n=1 Tax=unclassified Nocardia TaxID=2637762 RepID=UPI0036A4E9E0
MTTTRRIGLVWAVLIAATGVSWLTGTEFGNRSESAVTVLLLAVSFFKIRLIGLQFMDIRTAPRGLRAWFEAYIAGVLGILIALSVLA